jgi:hypothetical protein
MHALLRDRRCVSARDLLRLSLASIGRRYNSGIGSSFGAVRNRHLTRLAAARERHCSATS